MKESKQKKTLTPNLRIIFAFTCRFDMRLYIWRTNAYDQGDFSFFHKVPSHKSRGNVSFP